MVVDTTHTNAQFYIQEKLICGFTVKSVKYSPFSCVEFFNRVHNVIMGNTYNRAMSVQTVFCLVPWIEKPKKTFTGLRQRLVYDQNQP